MKFVILLHKYMKNVRLSALVLALMMAWAVFSGMIAYGRAESVLSDTSVLSSAATENAYMLMQFPSREDIMTGADQDKAEEMEGLLESEPIVEHIFSIRVANPVSYNGYDISIILYEPEMLAFFPELNRMGIDFSENPDGCILGSKTFAALNTGDTIELNFSKTITNPKLAAFPVAGHITPPYRRMSFTTSASKPYAGDLFDEGDVVIMQATDTVMEQINAYARRIECDTNLMVVFREGTTQEEQEALLRRVAPAWFVAPLEQILSNSKQITENTLKQELPQPLFLAGASLVAYLSIVVLTLKKKEKDIAVLYLCGASRRRCAMLSFTAFQLIALFPVAANAVVVYFWPSLSWNSTSYLPMDTSTALGVYLTDYIRFLLRILEETKLGVSSLWIILGYYLITVAISVAVTIGTMKKHTPITYLKGASQ